MDVGAIREQTGGMGVTVEPMHPGLRPFIEPLLRACGKAFSEEEIRVALGMAEAALRGEYAILATVEEGRLMGYCLAGPTPLTDSTWHLYWLCVDPEFQRQGVAHALQFALEDTIRASGGERIVVETAGRADYEPARAFYRSAGYAACGSIADYYRSGDACVFFCKVIS